LKRRRRRRSQRAALANPRVAGAESDGNGNQLRLFIAGRRCRST
jgi:hypothetical protein